MEDETVRSQVAKLLVGLRGLKELSTEFAKTIGESDSLARRELRGYLIEVGSLLSAKDVEHCFDEILSCNPKLRSEVIESLKVEIERLGGTCL